MLQKGRQGDRKANASGRLDHQRQQQPQHQHEHNEMFSFLIEFD